MHGEDAPPSGMGTAAELGDGGCNVIFKDRGRVIGRWSSWESASVALDQLQELGGRYEYRLEEFHRWVQGLGHTVTCSLCNAAHEAVVPAGNAAAGQWR
ncbi:conserved hypothetical protein [Arthrobacter sp. 9AX]|nr:conserved hypothetical protein [Arthrobacter sp. 9AX]